MGVHILHDREAKLATIYCSTMDWSLGPVFCKEPRLDLDAEEVAQKFLGWLALDPRELNEDSLEVRVADFYATMNSWAGFCDRCEVAVVIGKEVKDPRYCHQLFCSVECGERK